VKAAGELIPEQQAENARQRRRVAYAGPDSHRHRGRDIAQSRIATERAPNQ